ncbi:MAG: putative bifunctional diguanylate cyclase/phosphodiesterase [Nitrospinota bacterium]
MVQFSVVSFVMLATIALALAIVLSNKIRSDAVDALIDEAVETVRGRLVSAITPADLEVPMSGEGYRRFHEFVQKSIVSERTARVKLWSKDGTVIYSDDPASVGMKFPVKGNLLKALRGENAAKIKIPQDAKNGRKRDLGSLVQVYTPIIFPDVNGTRGVFEIYQYYGPTAKRINHLKNRLVGSIGTGFFMLYGTLLFVARARRKTIKRHEKELSNLAYYDSLTSLPNRQLFYERLHQTVARAKRHGTRAAIMFLDLDEFKRVNDTLGHEAGDLLLQAVAQRMKGCLRESDMVARLAGDEFTVVLDDITQEQDAVRVAQTIIKAFSMPFKVEGQELFFTPSIGISLYPSDGTDVEALVKRADISMYRAKAEGGNGFKLYDRAMEALTFRRLRLENSLRKALEKGKLVLHYQPQADLTTGEIIGFEALLRWEDPEAGMISPSKFIPVAEDTGLIVPIGEWVLRTACWQNKAWQEQGFPPIRVNVNLSARQLREKRLAETVAQILEETGLSPNCLVLEVTESAAMRDADHAIAMMKSLKEMGVKLSIDDFGIGYSSMSFLKRFPIDKLKIDRSFVRGIPADRDDAAITTAIIALAASLKLEAIAEGVETDEQLSFLAAQGCHSAQGYILAPPMPPAEVFAQWFLAKWKEKVGREVRRGFMVKKGGLRLLMPKRPPGGLRLQPEAGALGRAVGGL